MSSSQADQRPRGPSHHESRDRWRADESDMQIARLESREQSYVYPEDDLDDDYRSSRNGRNRGKGQPYPPYPKGNDFESMLPDGRYDYDDRRPKRRDAPPSPPSYAKPSSRKSAQEKIPGSFPEEADSRRPTDKAADDRRRIEYAPDPRIQKSSSRDKGSSRYYEDDDYHDDRRHSQVAAPPSTRSAVSGRKVRYDDSDSDSDGDDHKLDDRRSGPLTRFAEPARGGGNDRKPPQINDDILKHLPQKYANHYSNDDHGMSEMHSRHSKEDREDKYSRTSYGRTPKSGEGGLPDNKLDFLPQKYSQKYKSSNDDHASDRDSYRDGGRGDGRYDERRNGRPYEEEPAYGRAGPTSAYEDERASTMRYEKTGREDDRKYFRTERDDDASASKTPRRDEENGKKPQRSYYPGDDQDFETNIITATPRDSYVSKNPDPRRTFDEEPNTKRPQRESYTTDPRDSRHRVAIPSPGDLRLDDDAHGSRPDVVTVGSRGSQYDDTRDHRDYRGSRHKSSTIEHGSSEQDKVRDRRSDKSHGSHGSSSLKVASNGHERDRSRDRRGDASRDKSPQPSKERMSLLSVDIPKAAPGLTVSAAPASPLLESYHGTYQESSPMPSPLLLASPEPGADMQALVPLSPITSDVELGESKRKSRRARFHDPEDIATRLARALKGDGPPDKEPLIEILPSLTHNQVLELRSQYKNLVKAGSHKKGVNIAKHIRSRLKDEDPNLMKACYAVALGEWESEAYWANFWYQGDKTRREMLIEALMGRSNDEIHRIREAFTDKKYDNSLVNCMKTELKEDKFKKAVLMVLEEKRMEDVNSHGHRVPLDFELVDKDVEQLRKAIKAEKGGETLMISIVVKRSDGHLRAVLQEYEKSYKSNFARESLKRSGNLVGELLAHILNGVINRPVRDALLLHHAVTASRKDGLRRELLISRLVRYHWDPVHMQAVKKAYRERYGKDLSEAVRDASSGQWGEFCMELCIARVPNDVKRVERVSSAR